MVALSNYSELLDARRSRMECHKVSKCKLRERVVDTKLPFAPVTGTTCISQHTILLVLRWTLCQPPFVLPIFFLPLRRTSRISRVPREPLAANCLRIESTYHRTFRILPWEVPRSCIHWNLIAEGGRGPLTYGNVSKICRWNRHSLVRRHFSCLFTEFASLNAKYKKLCTQVHFSVVAQQFRSLSHQISYK